MSATVTATPEEHHEPTIEQQYVETCQHIRLLSNVLLRARATLKAKRLYEELYPEARHGGDRRGKSTVKSFADAIAERTNQSARSVRLDVEIAKSLDGDVQELLRDTSIASQTTTLAALAKAKPPVQREAAKRFADVSSSEGPAAAEKALKTVLVDVRPPKRQPSPAPVTTVLIGASGREVVKIAGRNIEVAAMPGTALELHDIGRAVTEKPTTPVAKGLTPDNWQHVAVEVARQLCPHLAVDVGERSVTLTAKALDIVGCVTLTWCPPGEHPLTKGRPADGPVIEIEYLHADYREDAKPSTSDERAMWVGKSAKSKQAKHLRQHVEIALRREGIIE